jgi:hypothetical protein
VKQVYEALKVDLAGSMDLRAIVVLPMWTHKTKFLLLRCAYNVLFGHPVWKVYHPVWSVCPSSCWIVCCIVEDCECVDIYTNSCTQYKY